MKSWKTTASSIAAALFAFVLFSPQWFQWAPWLIDIARFGVAGGLVSFGLSAKDFNVTGGTTRQ